MVGNFPQAFSHLALVSAAIRLEQARPDRPSTISEIISPNRTYAPTLVTTTGRTTR